MSIDHGFNESVTEASQLLEQLTQLLQEERKALELSDAEKTQALLEQKTLLLNSLQSNASKRQQLLTSLGFEPNETGAQNFLLQLPKETAADIKPKWKLLQRQLQTCKDTNAVNGQVIHRSRQQIDTLLGLLQGNRDSGKIYNHAGTAETIQNKPALAKA